MVKVGCPGCGASYTVSESRIPDDGLKMRCPKCSERFMVHQSGATSPVVSEAAAPPKAPGPAPIEDAAAGGTPPMPVAVPPPGTGTSPSPMAPPPAAGTPPMPLTIPPPEEPSPPDETPSGASDELDAAIPIEALPPPPPGAGGSPPGTPVEPTPPLGSAVPPNHLAAPASPAADPVSDIEFAIPISPRTASQEIGYAAPTAASKAQPAESGDASDSAFDADLPTPRSISGGAMDAALPAPRHVGSDLPTPRDQTALPAVPSGAEAGGFGVLDLPPALAEPAGPQEADLPAPSAGPDLPAPAFSSDLPAPAFDTELPSPLADAGLPAPTADGDLPSSKAGALSSGLFDLPSQLDGSNEDQSGLPAPTEGSGLPAPTEGSDLPTSAEVGGEFELEEDVAADGELADDLERPSGAPLVPIKRRRSKKTRIALAIVPLLTIAGGALTLTPHGPYGFYTISDTLNRADHELALTTFQQGTQTSLDKDSYADIINIADEAAVQQSQMPRFKPMTAYAAYLALFSSIRFGNNVQKNAAGKQLIQSVPSDDASHLVQLARVALQTVENPNNAAYDAAASLTSLNPDDIEANILQGEIALQLKRTKEAAAPWAHVVKLKRSARSLFGLARTHQLLGKSDEAEKLCTEVIKLNKNHAGARLLLIKIYTATKAKQKQAMALLKELTEKGAINANASTSELAAAYNHLGQLNLQQARYSAAEKAFAEALKLEPQSKTALIGAGEVFYKSGRYSKSAARFEAVIARERDNLNATIGLGKTLLAMERPKAAKRVMLRVSKVHGKNPLVGYWLGRCYEALGNRESADKTYVNVIKRSSGDPNIVLAYVARSNLLSRQGKETEARAVLTEASKQFPKNAELHQAKGDVALHNGRLDEATKEFLQALELDKQNLGAQFKLAITHRRAQKLKEAQKYFEIVAKADESYPGLALERGLLFEDLGQTDRALKLYADALSKAPDDIDLKFRVGSTQVLSGHGEQALKLLREVYAQRSKSAEVNHFLGRALLLIGKEPTQALRFLTTAVRRDPTRAEYHLYQGWAANEAAQSLIAESAIAKALELDHNLADAYWQRGVMLQKRGQTIHALEDVMTALEKRPSRFEAYATMARCYQDQSNYAAAATAWAKAISGNNRVPEWHFRLGKILMNRGDTAGGGNHIGQAIALIKKKSSTRAYGWLWNAYLLWGDALRGTDAKRAISAYRRFLEIAPPDNAYRDEAKRNIRSLGGRIR